MNKYYKNFILCGNIDYHCLLCQETFQKITDLEKHIRWEKHRKNIKDQVYLTKFKKDCIYKVGTYHYCEICNFVITNNADVSKHVTDKPHIDYKQSPKSLPETCLAKYESGYITIKKTVINRGHWNSVVDKKCLLCCADVKNIDDHIKKQEHVIKVIQSETSYENDVFYRKIKEDMFHCFTCKKVFLSKSSFQNHISSCKNYDEIDISELAAAGPNKPIGNTHKMAKLQRELIGTLQEFFQINEKDNTAICKCCSTSVGISFNEMIMHMEMEHDDVDDKNKEEEKPEEEKTPQTDSSKEVVYVDIVDSGKRRSELSKYGKEHYIKLNHNGSKGYCLLCDRYIAAHMNNFKEHVKGVIHQGHIELKTYEYEESELCEAVHINSFIKSLKFSRELQAYWINNEFWVNLMSLCLFHPAVVNPHYKKTKCFACDEIIDQGTESVHGMSDVHKKKLNAAKVLKLPNEFIREIRANLFHCGFCNLTFPFDTMGKHLMSFNHVFTKKDKLTMTDEYLFNIDTVRNNDIYMQLLRVLNIIETPQ